MNTQSNATPEFFDSQGITPSVLPRTRSMYWSVRRELWEYRSIYLAPLALAGLALVGFLIATIGRAMSSNLGQRLTVLEQPYTFAATMIMGAAFVVGLFYCLDALHGERRERSILFWKSLPVSDLIVVLSKASIAFVALPLVALAITVATHFLMLLLSTAELQRSGLSAATLWAQVWVFDAHLLYHLLTVHVLWYAPLYAWMLLVSGWARRAPFLWASLPLLAIGVVEKIVFNTSHFAAMIGYRFSGPEGFDLTEPGKFAMHPMMHLALGKFLSTPGLWTGLLAAALFLALAARLRRCQGPI